MENEEKVQKMMCESNGSRNEGRENLKRTLRNILELKKKIMKMNNSLKRFSSFKRAKDAVNLKKR